MEDDKMHVLELMQTSKEFTRSIIESSNDCIKILDLEGRLKFMSQGGQRLMEIEDITPYLNESWVDFWKGKDHEAALGAVSKAKKGKIGTFRGYCPTAKHTPKWWEIIVSPILDKQGNVEYLLSISRDITGKKKKEDHILNLSAILECIRRVNKIVVHEKEPGILIQKVCHTIVETRGIHSAWIALMDQSEDFLTCAHSGLDDDFLSIVDRLKRGDWPTCIQKALRQQALVVIRDPYSICTDCALSAKYSGNAAMTVRLEHHGNIYGILVISIPEEMAENREERKLIREIADDISFAFHSNDLEKQRNYSRKLLEESEEKYRLLVKNLSSLVYKGYPDWSVEFFDDKIEALTGYSADEFNSRKLKWSDIIVNEDLETVRNSFIKALNTKGSFVREYRIESKAKDVIWIQERGQIVRDENGNMDYITGVFFDIIGLKQAEEEKKKLQAQLLQAQKMEAIGTLTGGIAHDFNNLLTTIIGYSELALDDLIKDTPLYDTIKEIRKAGRRAGLLTRQLLAFSRKQVIQPEILNINDILTGTEKMLRRTIREDIDMVSVFTPELWNVEMDPGQMEQVLMNLAINARDAMPKGGKLTIETANVELDEAYFRDHSVESNPGPHVMLAVTDSGTGMDEQTRFRIFEPFFTTKEMGSGTGLGLSTVYGIVKQNKGHISVYSEPGEGTTFKVYLPAVMQDIEGAKEEDKAFVDQLGGTETVLLVEDDDMLCRMAQKILETHGYTVLSAHNSDEALKIANYHHDSIHLLLTDLVIPGMNGKELAGRIESILPGIKVLYMSGYTDNAIAHHGVLDRDINFIQKPFSPNDLVQKVREVLDRDIED